MSRLNFFSARFPATCTPSAAQAAPLSPICARICQYRTCSWTYRWNKYFFAACLRATWPISCERTAAHKPRLVPIKRDKPVKATTSPSASENALTAGLSETLNVHAYGRPKPEIISVFTRLWKTSVPTRPAASSGTSFCGPSSTLCFAANWKSTSKLDGRSIVSAIFGAFLPAKAGLCAIARNKIRQKSARRKRMRPTLPPQNRLLCFSQNSRRSDLRQDETTETSDLASPVSVPCHAAIKYGSVHRCDMAFRWRTSARLCHAETNF